MLILLKVELVFFKVLFTFNIDWKFIVIDTFMFNVKKYHKVLKFKALLTKQLFEQFFHKLLYKVVFV